MGMHAVILLGLSFSTMFIKNEEIQKTYQALILLPILRLVNLSMPVFYETTLYSLIFIYSLLAIPASIAATTSGIYSHAARDNLQENMDLCSALNIAGPLASRRRISDNQD